MTPPVVPPAVSACRETALFDLPASTNTPPSELRASATYFCASHPIGSFDASGPTTDHTHTSLPVGPRRQSGRRGPGSYLDATHLLFQALAKRELPVASCSTLSPCTTAWDLLKPFLSLVTW